MDWENQETERKPPAPFAVPVVLLASVTCHLNAGFQFQSNFRSLGLPSHYPNQFYLLLLISFFLSILTSVLYFLNIKRKFLWLPLFFQVFFLVLIGLPMGNFLQVEFSILMVLLFEAALFYPYPKTILISAGIIAVNLAFQQPVSAWNTDQPRASLSEILFFAVYASITAFALNGMKYFIQTLAESKKLSRQLDNAINRLTDANIGFQKYATSVEEISMKKERNRITREIHDTTGYGLTNLIMMMEAATDLVGKEPARLTDLLEKARCQAQDVLNDTRRAMRQLRSVESIKHEGLAAIHKLCKAFEEATNVHVRIEFGNVSWSYGDKIDLAVYRMVQEGLTNAFKHGKATQIRLHFWQHEQGIWIHIHDNGSGSQIVNEGIGFSGMRERIEQLGGEFQASTKQDGFEVSAWIPCGGKDTWAR